MLVVEQFVLLPHPPPGLHPLGKYSAHVSSSLCPTSARHPGPRPPPPPSSSSPLAVTSRNPARAGSSAPAGPAPRDPAAVHAPSPRSPARLARAPPGCDQRRCREVDARCTRQTRSSTHPTSRPRAASPRPHPRVRGPDRPLHPRPSRLALSGAGAGGSRPRSAGPLRPAPLALQARLQGGGRGSRDAANRRSRGAPDYFAPSLPPGRSPLRAPPPAGKPAANAAVTRLPARAHPAPPCPVWP